MDLKRISGGCAITAASGDVLALVRGGADAATITGIRRGAALGLALIILEHEQAIGARFERGS